MTSQIKPHFIYNTLNSIRALVRIDPETAYNTIYDFSTYLRENLRSLEDVDVIPFSQELKHVKAYVNIEEIRFEERVQVVFDIREQNFQCRHFLSSLWWKMLLSMGYVKNPGRNGLDPQL